MQTLCKNLITTQNLIPKFKIRVKARVPENTPFDKPCPNQYEIHTYYPRTGQVYEYASHIKTKPKYIRA